jgi:hypothetical protein
VQITSQTTGRAAGRVVRQEMQSVAGQMTPQATRYVIRPATGQALVRIAGQAAENIPRQIASEIAFPTTDEATVQTTSKTILQVIPQTGVSLTSIKPNATSCKLLGRESVSGQHYSLVGSAPKPVPARARALTIRGTRITFLLMQGQIRPNPTTRSLRPRSLFLLLRPPSSILRLPSFSWIPPSSFLHPHSCPQPSSLFFPPSSVLSRPAPRRKRIASPVRNPVRNA